MISKEEFLLAWNNHVGMHKLSDMITNDFLEHQNFDFAKKQHWWLRQRYPNDCATLFFKNLILLNFYEEALTELNRIFGKVYISENLLIESLIKLRFELNRNVVNGNHIYRLHLFWLSPITKFGKDNLDDLLEVLDIILTNEFKNGFLEQFYEISEFGKIKSTFKRKEYYKYFGSSSASKKELEKLKVKNPNVKASKDDLIYIIGSASANLMREAENNLRIAMGGKKIGEGYISETELYYRIKNHFSNLKVIQHGRPKFLGRQHFDVWLPEVNIAIEYQGAQHDKPVDFFGGQDAFVKNQKRDELKRKKCKLNEVSLFEVRPDYNFEALINEIEHRINK